MLNVPFRRKLLVGLTMFLPSSVKILAYRLMGADIGRNVRIGLGSYILAEKIVLKNGAALGGNVRVTCREIVVDEDAVIPDDVTIDGESIFSLGKRCYLGPGAYVNVAEPVILEDDVGMGGRIYTHGVWPSYLEGYPRKFAAVLIKKGAWIPPSTTILPGVTIGENAIIGTGAVVTQSIPSRAFAVGVPAKVVRSVDEMQVKLTENQKDARVKEIMQNFERWIANGANIRQNVTEGGHTFILTVVRSSFIGGKKSWAIYYANESVTPELIDSLLSFTGKFAKIIIVSLQTLHQDSLAKMRNDPISRNFFDWIDLENYTIKLSSDSLLTQLKSFFRSYYGVRLKTEGRQ